MKYNIYGYLTHNDAEENSRLNFSEISKTFFQGFLEASETLIAGIIQDQMGVWEIKGFVSEKRITFTLTCANEKDTNLNLYNGVQFLFLKTKDDIEGSYFGKLVYPKDYPQSFEIIGGYSVISDIEPIPLEFQPIKQKQAVFLSINCL